MSLRLSLAVLCCLATSLPAGELNHRGRPWAMHVIDSTSRGADGLDTRDINGDGRFDLVSGWEEGGVVRVYLHPGGDAAHKPWPQVTVGRVKSVEDAHFVDVDQDGRLDVVSSAEGRTRQLAVHFAPRDAAELLNGDHWESVVVPDSIGEQLFMWTIPIRIAGESAPVLASGAKGSGAQIGLWTFPNGGRELNKSIFHPLRNVGWVMTLQAIDMNGDGREDLLCTDRKGSRRGIFWLQQPEKDALTTEWTEHSLGGGDAETMFLTTGDLNGDDRTDLAIVTRRGPILVYYADAEQKNGFRLEEIPRPVNCGLGKGVAIADVNGDGTADLVLTNAEAKGQSGAVWLSRDADGTNWKTHEISGMNRGIKFDLALMRDVDGDGDLDLLTCEERDNLGVIWYENPTRSPGKR